MIPGIHARVPLSRQGPDRCPLRYGQGSASGVCALRVCVPDSPGRETRSGMFRPEGLRDVPGNRLLRFLFRDLCLGNLRSGVSGREVPDGEFAQGGSGFGFVFRGGPGGWFGNGGSGFRAGVCFPGSARDTGCGVARLSYTLSDSSVCHRCISREETHPLDGMRFTD